MRMRMLLTWLGIALLGAACSNTTRASEVETPQNLHVMAKRIDEGYAPNVPVSGRTRAGAMYSDPGRPSGNHLYVSVAQQPAGHQLCIALRSRDGRYTGYWSAALPDTNAPYLLEVKYETEKPQFYEKVRDTYEEVGDNSEDRRDKLVALATVRHTCDPGSKVLQILPVAWGRPAANASVQIFINSSRMRAVLVIPSDEQGPKIQEPKVIECEQIEAPQKIAFDRKCDLSNIPEGAQPEKAAIIRFRGPNPAPPVAFPLLLQ